MGVYQLTDSDQARTRANELITNLAELPDPRDRKLGRTLHSSANELLAHFDHPKVSNGPPRTSPLR
jgi:hypothetical protein